MKAITVRINGEFEKMFNQIKEEYEKEFNMQISDAQIIKRLIKIEHTKIKSK